jgi:RimJ/RimL family protein N-acetyltransferase
MADSGAEIVAETERLVLRREVPGDIEIWLEHMNTPEVMDKVGGVKTAERVAEDFARMAQTGEGELPFLLVARKADGMLLGKCGLAPIATELAPNALRDQVQVGWTLRADCWGHGYATEAARAVLAMAFDRFGMAMVYSQTSERNRASWRVMERLGMTRLAGLDYDDPDYPPEDNPTMVWGMTRDAWQTAQAGAAADA